MMETHPPELSSVDIGDAQIPYLSYGDHGPPVVMLHATGFLPWLWHPIAVRLSQNHRVIAPYLCDHRPSDPHDGGLKWMQLASDLTQLCRRLGLADVLFVGHSMGATVSMLAHAVHGATAAGMVLIEPIFLPSEAYDTAVTLDQHPLAAKALKRRNQWPDRESVRSDFLTKPFFQSWDPEVLSLYIEHGIRTCDKGVRLCCSPRREAALFMGGMRHDPWPELPKVGCPTLVVEGALSENRHFIDLPRAAELIPQGHYTRMEGAGHLIPMEKPDETARIVQLFFR